MIHLDESKLGLMAGDGNVFCDGKTRFNTNLLILLVNFAALYNRFFAYFQMTKILYFYKQYFNIKKNGT